MANMNLSNRDGDGVMDFELTADDLDTGSVASDEILDGAIVNADVNASAAIAWSKMAAVADGSILVGSAAAVPTVVAMSGDATMVNTGAVTVASANAAFDVGTNITMALEVNHTISVTASTTTDTAGGNLTIASAAGNGTGVGGTLALDGGAGGATGAGGPINITSGASTAVTTGTAAASGSITIAAGLPGGATTGVAGAGGAISISGQTGADATGATGEGGAGSNIAITTGAGGACTDAAGGVETGGAGGTMTLVGGAGGALNAASTGTGGQGGSIDLRPGLGGAAAGGTAGVEGVIRLDGTVAQAYTVTAMTTSDTITVAALRGGMITANQGASGAATYTMPTGTVLDAALPSDFAVGDVLEFTITNISTDAAEDVTVAGAAGMTAVGNMTVASNDAVGSIAAATFRILKTAANTFSFYRVS